MNEIVAFREEVERLAAIREAEEFYRHQIGRRVTLLYIEATAREEEVARKTVRLANRNYLQITVRGALILENAKKTPVKVEITKDLWGEVEEAGGGKAAKKPGLWGVNPHSVLEWKLALPPGGKRTMEYLYHFWLAL